jgi:hypothetical protein
MAGGANPQQTQAAQGLGGVGGNGAGRADGAGIPRALPASAGIHTQASSVNGTTGADMRGGGGGANAGTGTGLYQPTQAPQIQAPQVQAPQGGGGAPNVYQQSANAYTAALGGTAAGMGFQAPTIEGQGYSASNAGSRGYSAASMAGVGPITAQNVQAGQIAGSDLSAYTNPYENQVVGQALGDIERSRLMQQNQLGAQASAAGAFGGSRQGIAESETNRAFADQAARTASGLRQSGYANAQQMAGQDIASQMQAAMANQGANLSAQGQTAGNNLSTQQFNQGATNQASQFGASASNAAQMQNAQMKSQASQFSANAANQAAMANQQAAMAANQSRLGAASQMGSLSNLGFGFGNTIADRQLAQGGMQQGVQQMLIDAAKGQYGGFTGAPTNALQTNIAATGAANMGQNTTTAKKNPGLFDYLSLGASFGAGG